MANPDDFLYEFAVVRYVPDVVREEFLNIGLLMMCKRRRWMQGAIAIDEERLKAFDPKVDLQRLLSQASLFERSDVPSGGLPVEERYRWLTAVKSAVLQVSPSHPGLLAVEGEVGRPEAEQLLGEEFERLLECHVK